MPFNFPQIRLWLIYSVIWTFHHDVEKLYLVTVGGQVIETTYNHPFWVSGKGWMHAEDMQVGDLLEKADGSTLKIEKIEVVAKQATVYNFTVAEHHTYFVSDLGIWVHNTGGECGVEIKIPTWTGSGPTPGVIGINALSKSSGALKNYFPKDGVIEFVFDSKTYTFLVGKPESVSFIGSPHQKLVQTIAASDSTVVGGMFKRGPKGEIITNEFSGHYHQNWSPEVRELYIKTLKDLGVEIMHSGGISF
jgi:hypothetical protein